MKRTLCALLAALALAAPPPGQAEEARQLTLDDFDIHQYVGSRGLSPVSVMRLDTNAEILVACRQPRTRDELEAMGIHAVESQLVLLRAMRMLRQAEGRFETLVPLLDAEATARLRRATGALTPAIVAEVETEVKALGRALAEGGFGEQLYAVLFSYVLDGMAWEFFEEYKEIQPRRLTATSPHWAGEVWGTYPPRQRAVGTSTIVSGDLKLRVTRPPAPGSPVDLLLGGWRDLRAVLRHHVDAASPVDPAALAGLAPFGVVDKAGGLALPVLVEKPGEKIFELAQRVTEKVTEAARERLDLEALARDLGLRSRQQTLIVAYHELMWDLMDAFETAGLAPRPRILSTPESAGPADVAAVAFVVDRRRDGPNRQDEEVDTGEE